MTAEFRENPFQQIQLESPKHLTVFRDEHNCPQAKFKDLALEAFDSVLSESDILEVVGLKDIFHIRQNLQKIHFSLPMWTSLISPTLHFATPTYTLFRDPANLGEAANKLIRKGRQNENGSGHDTTVVDVMYGLQPQEFSGRSFSDNQSFDHEEIRALPIGLEDYSTYCYLRLIFELGDNGRLNKVTPHLVVYKKLDDDKTDNYLQKFLN